jgi:preprotein translocase subunit SecD
LGIQTGECVRIALELDEGARAVPARLIEQPISERVIGPSIGADNVHRGIVSGLIGTALVIAFMLIYYMVGGSIAE